MNEEPKPRVLAVDDEPANLETLQRVFRKELDLTVALSAADGLRRLAEKPYDVVLSDFAMPTTNGLEFLKEVRTRYPLLNRVLLTAHSDLAEVLAGQASGVSSSLVSKPWDKVALLQLVSSLARLARVRQQAAARSGGTSGSAP